jgi:hypothetical protein
LEEFAGAVAEEFVDADLNFEGWVAAGAVDFVVRVADEGDGFFGGFGAQDVA